MILYENGACAVDARIYEIDETGKIQEKVKKEISAQIFYPESIAVIGASSDPNKIGYAVFRQDSYINCMHASNTQRIGFCAAN